MERFTQKESLGKKGFGETFRAVDKSTGNDCALKRVDVSKMSLEEYNSEAVLVQVAKRLAHPHVTVYVTGFVVAGTREYVLVSEYCPSKAAE